MNIINKTTNLIDGLNEWIGKAISWLVIILIVNVFLVVVLRYVFSVGFVWMQELYVWTHAAIFMAGAGYTLLHNDHVRIDLVYRTASRRYKAWVNLFGCLFFAAPLLMILFIKSWPQVARSFSTMERSAEAGGLPALYILKALIPIFCVLLGLQIIALILRSLGTLFGKNNDQPDITETKPTS